MPRITIPRGVYDVLVRQEGNDYIAYDRDGRVICKNSETGCLQEAVNSGETIYIDGIFFVNELKGYAKIIGTGDILPASGERVVFDPIINVNVNLAKDVIPARYGFIIDQFRQMVWNIYEIGGNASANVYKETKTVGFATYDEYGLLLKPDSSYNVTVYRQIPYMPSRTLIYFGVVDLNPPSSGSLAFGYVYRWVNKPSGAIIFLIDSTGQLIIRYVNTSSSVVDVPTGVNIANRPFAIALDVDVANQKFSVVVDNKRFDITDWYKYTDTNWGLAFLASAGTPSFRVVWFYAEPATYEQPYMELDGRIGSYSVSQSLSLYSLAMVTPSQCYVSIRRVGDDREVAKIGLPSCIDFYDYVHYWAVPQFTYENDWYLYVGLFKHNDVGYVYKYRVKDWSLVGSIQTPTGAYGRFMKMFNKLVVLQRDADYDLSVIELDTLNSWKIVTKGPNTNIVYPYLGGWQPNGRYSYVVWTNYTKDGLRKGVYAVVVDNVAGKVFSPYGREKNVPVVSEDVDLLIDDTTSTILTVTPVGDGVLIYRSGFYTPDIPTGYVLKPFLIRKIPNMHDLYISTEIDDVIGTVAPTAMTTYVLRDISGTLYSLIPKISLFGHFGEVDNMVSTKRTIVLPNKVLLAFSLLSLRYPKTRFYKVMCRVAYPPSHYTF